MGTENKDPAWEMISRHEGGQVPAIYPDSKGNLTVATGVNLEIALFLPKDVLDSLDQMKYDAMRKFFDIFSRRLSWPVLSEQRQSVVIDMIYALGPGRFSKFKNFCGAVTTESFGTAGAEIIDSKWHWDLVDVWIYYGAKPNVLLRTEELAEVMITGVEMEYPVADEATRGIVLEAIEKRTRKSRG